MSNIMMSNLRGNRLLELLTEVENTNLEYRYSISYDKIITYGIEIEYENISKYIVSKFIKKDHKNWLSKSDNSLDSGGEISSPILHGTKEDWIHLKEICNFLNRKKMNSLNNASFHIHVGRQVFSNCDELLLFIELYMIYEPILFRFGYGDKVSQRKNILKYSSPTTGELYTILPKLKECNSLEEMYCILSKLSRYNAINFSNINSDSDKKTIEYRLFNASSNPIVLQNDINTAINMSLTPKRSSIDKELLEYRINNELIIADRNDFWYNEVNILLALEFADTFFDNDIDKIFFLKQYFKGYESNYGYNNARYAKTFVK